MIARYLCIAAGLGGLATLGGWLQVVAAGGLVACLVAPMLRAPLERVPWAVLTLPILLGGAWLSWATGAREPALGLVLVYLLVQRFLARTGPADDRIAVALSALMLALAATRTEHPVFLLLMTVWTGALPIALLERPLGRWSAALPALVLGLAVSLFVVMPRLRDAAPVVEPAARTGFSDDLEVGTFANLLDDPTEVMRLKVTGSTAGPIYLRGMALDRFDGRRWHTEGGRVERDATTLGAVEPGMLRVDVVRRAMPQGVLFTTGRLAAVQTDSGRLQRDPQGNLFVGTDSTSWSFLAAPPFGPSSAAAAHHVPQLEGAERWLRIPANLDPRIPALAAQVAGSGDPVSKARRLRDHLRRNYGYTRSPGDVGAPTPLSTFLFERKTGHCGFYASSLAVMLRAQGLPARVITGFVANEPGADGVWSVRRADAHAWVEAWLPERGWVILDATAGPASAVLPPPQFVAPAGPTLASRLDRQWQGVLRYDLGSQKRALWTVGRGAERVVRLRPRGRPWLGWTLLVGSLCGLGAMAGWWLSKLVRRLAGEEQTLPSGRIASIHRRTRAQLERSGWVVPPSLPPVAAARWIRDRTEDREAADALEELAWLYYRVHLAGEAEAPHVVRARELAQQSSQLSPPP